MAIPKHKLAILISGLKPKKGADEEPPMDGEEDDGHDERLDTVVNQLADAIVAGKRDAVVEALHAFHDCITGEDEAEDAGEGADEEPMPGKY